MVFSYVFWIVFDDYISADTYVINNQPNGTNIKTNAGSTHIEGLQKFVDEKDLDVGFAFDGDADRCLCVDEKMSELAALLKIYLQVLENIRVTDKSAHRMIRQCRGYV